MKIELQALEHAYPGGDKALDGVDLTVCVQLVVAGLVTMIFRV